MGLSHDGMKYTDTTGDFLAWRKGGAFDARIECHKAPPDGGTAAFRMSCHIEHADKAPLLRALAAAWGLAAADVFPPAKAKAGRRFRWAPGLVGRMTRDAVEASKRQGSFGQAGAALGWLPWPDDYAVPSKSEAQLLGVFWLAYDAALQGQTVFPQPEQAVRTAVLAGLRAAKRRGLLPPGAFERLPPS